MLTNLFFRNAGIIWNQMISTSNSTTVFPVSTTTAPTSTVSKNVMLKIIASSNPSMQPVNLLLTVYRMLLVIWNKAF